MIDSDGTGGHHAARRPGGGRRVLEESNPVFS